MCINDCHTDTKKILNRLSRTIGHMESIKRMIQEGRDCSEVLVQIAAVKAAVNNTGKLILLDHLRHCMAEAVQTGDETAIEDFAQAIDQFIK